MADKNLNTGTFSVYIEFEDNNIFLNTSFIEEMYFIEDIFSYSMTGKLSFHDKQGILEFGPLTGNEKVYVTYGMDENITWEFDIYKINRIRPSNSPAISHENFIEMLLVDKNFYNLTMKQYSRSWKDEKYSTIVKDISNNMVGIDKFDLWENSVEKADFFYMPYWTPKNSIDWIMKRCSGLNYRLPGYLYFKNSKGMNFITLESLLQGRGKKITHQYEVTENTYTFSGEAVDDINRIITYNLSGIDNLSKLNLKGEHRKGYDFKRKKFLNEENDYSDGINNLTLLGRWSLFTDISDNDSFNKLTGETNEYIINNIFYNEWFKKYSMQQTIAISVPGHEERYAGGIIRIKWPSGEKKEEFNKNFEGNYLVKSITHYFGNTFPIYKQRMVLIKNAYEDSNKENLKKAEKKNLKV